MNAAMRVLAALALAALALSGARAAQADEARFRAGFNLLVPFLWPERAADGAGGYASQPFPGIEAALAAHDFAALRAAGFDHARLSVNAGPFLAAASPEQEAALIGQVSGFAETLAGHGLDVVVALLAPFDDSGSPVPARLLDAPDGPAFGAYAAFAARLAGALARADRDAFALEPLNEPQAECRARGKTDWSVYQDALLARLRAAAPGLAVFATGGCWSSVEGAVLLDGALLRRPDTYLSVHFYEPFLFTHQTATWTLPYLAGVIGVPYPPEAGTRAQALARTRARFSAREDTRGRGDLLGEAEAAIHAYFDGDARADIRRRLDRLDAWRARHGIDPGRIVVTEFGAVRQLDDGAETNAGSRRTWLAELRAAMEARGWGWTVFVLKGDPFGLYRDPADARPDPDLIRALGLAPAR